MLLAKKNKTINPGTNHILANKFLLQIIYFKKKETLRYIFNKASFRF